MVMGPKNQVLSPERLEKSDFVSFEALFRMAIIFGLLASAVPKLHVGLSEGRRRRKRK